MVSNDPLILKLPESKTPGDKGLRYSCQQELSLKNLDYPLTQRTRCNYPFPVVIITILCCHCSDKNLKQKKILPDVMFQNNSSQLVIIFQTKKMQHHHDISRYTHLKLYFTVICPFDI